MSYFDDASLVMIPSGYKTSKVYSVKPTSGDGDLTFTRSNDTATRVGPNGLIEKVRTNLILQSETFDNAAWDKVTTTISANTTANPIDGTVNADTITLGAGTTQKFVAQVISLNGNYTISVYLKAGTHQFAQILLGTDSTPFANFDLVNGTASASGSTATIVSAGNGWYRCSMAFSTSTGNSVFILASDSLATSRFQITSSTGTLIAFGYQVETGDIATDYIATTSAAVSVGPVANVPRLDYLNSSCPRLLLEPQRSNLILYSEQFDNAYWTKSGATISANSIISPDGFVNADSLIESAANERHTVTMSNTPVSAVAHTASVFVRANGRTKFALSEEIATGIYASFDLTTGVVLDQSGISATIKSYGNGWFRCDYTMTSATFFMLRIVLLPDSYVSGAVTGTYLGNGTSGIFLYGCQLEAGAYATSYIPTLGAAVTRGADACSKTGISSLIGQTEGTIFAQWTSSNANTSGRIVAISNGGFANRIAVLEDASKIRVFISNANVVQIDETNLGNYTGSHKIAVAYANNNLAVYLDGTLVLSRSTLSVPACSALYVGTLEDGTSATPLNGGVAQTLLFKTRLSNADLAALTA